MLTVFMDYRGVVHHEFLPEGQIVNKEYYLGVMRRLREAIRQKRPDLRANNSWILHHDNAPSHNANVIREHLAKNERNTIQQPPNLPDLTPCDFILFGRLKKPLRGTRYMTRDEVVETSNMALMAIPQTDYKKCFEDSLGKTFSTFSREILKYCGTFFTSDMNSETQNTKIYKLSCAKIEPSRNRKFCSA